ILGGFLPSLWVARRVASLGKPSRPSESPTSTGRASLSPPLISESKPEARLDGQRIELSKEQGALPPPLPAQAVLSQPAPRSPPQHQATNGYLRCLGIIVACVLIGWFALASCDSSTPSFNV